MLLYLLALGILLAMSCVLGLAFYIFIVPALFEGRMAHTTTQGSRE